MLKIVVLDSGQGGECFADQLEEELPVVKVIRVIDWRNAEDFLKSPRLARRAAEKALIPYIGRCDLIVLANYLLSTTSLKYFQKKYQTQKFVGFKLVIPATSLSRPTAILTTKAMTRTLVYHDYIFRLKRKTTTFCLDKWVALIDDGELTDEMIKLLLEKYYLKNNIRLEELILACGQFSDLIPNFREIDKNLKITDSTRDTISDIYKTLHIRGGARKKKD